MHPMKSFGDTAEVTQKQSNEEDEMAFLSKMTPQQRQLVSQLRETANICLWCQKLLTGKKRPQARYCSESHRVMYARKQAKPVTAPDITEETRNTFPLTEAKPVTAGHTRYWLDVKGHRRCSDCLPSVPGVAWFEVSSTLDDARYEWEERQGMREG